MEEIGQDRVNSIKNADLVNVWCQSEKSNRILSVFEKICSLLALEECRDQIVKELMTTSRLFCLKMSNKWKEVRRSTDRLRQRHESWLQQEIRLPKELVAVTFIEEEKPVPNQPRGIPIKPFDEASLKKKKRRLAELVASRTTDELQLAAEMARGKTTIRGETSSLTSHQALALYLDLDLSENKYKVLRSVVNAVHPNCFPSLYKLNQAKNSLLPASITVTETSAEVCLQELLDLTAQSIINISYVDKDRSRFKLVCKWGFDGSSGHSQYKQKFTDVFSTDEYLFLEALVPLKLVDLDTGRDVWVNTRSSSTLYCRPVKFIFQKETAGLVLEEEKAMNEKIEQLKISSLKTKWCSECHVSYELLFTMMDGSVSNVLSDTNAASRCIIFFATPKEMNTQNVLSKAPNVENYRFGLSTLHCWIRFFECLLHIAYRLPIKSWQVKGNENKEIVDLNKKKIQADFKLKMGLLVDKPKPGYGSTNDGNTARRFFLNPDLSSEITGIEKKLIIKFSTILRVLSSGCTINVEEFKKLDETRELYISLYGWYYMPSSVHKVLVHGCEIISAFALPIGQLSEDALEARHKEVRKHRLSHTRKCSRTDSNKDLMRRLLLTSEPLLSNQRKITTKKGMNREGEIQKYIQVEDTSISYNIDNLDLQLSSTEEFSDSD